MHNYYCIESRKYMSWHVFNGLLQESPVESLHGGSPGCFLAKEAFSLLKVLSVKPKIQK